nr:hypothetical protein [Chthonobacter rhizosphaerae]
MHPVAGALALLTILAFWTATVVSELSGDPAAVLAVKTAILQGLVVLVPAMAAVGITGMRLGGRARHPLVAAKRRRMPVIAANGLLVLAPAAVYLQAKAAAGAFDSSFLLVQAVEFVAGAVNIALLGLSFRDGLRLKGRIGRAPTAA